MLITIARQCGCDAESVGRLLAARFGAPLYTRKDFLAKAQERGYYDELRDFFSEQPLNALAMAATFQDAATNEVRRRLRRAVEDFIGDEDCIIVGRCGNILFADRPDLTSAFLHAPLSERVARTAERHVISRNEAAERIDRIDRERAAYHRYYTGHTWGDAADYDISLNVSCCGAELAADFIARLAEPKPTNLRP